MSPKNRMALAAAAAAWLAGGTPAPAWSQVPAPAESATSLDGLLTLTLTSASPSDAVGIDNTYTWTATNNSPTVTLEGVTLGSHWGDWCGGNDCTPPGPTLISAPGCAGQGPDEIPQDAKFGVWCTPLSGVTLLPGQSVSGAVTLRPGAGGPPDYTVYSLYNDPKTGRQLFVPFIPAIKHTKMVAPAATDIQVKGSASNGSPAAGSTFTYTFEVKNAGPWGTFGGIVLVDTLPAPLTYVSSSVSLFGGIDLVACSAQGQTVMCSLPDMQSGGTTNQATIAITVAASGVPRQIVNTAAAMLVLPQTDANTANNTATVTVTTR